MPRHDTAEPDSDWWFNADFGKYEAPRLSQQLQTGPPRNILDGYWGNWPTTIPELRCIFRGAGVHWTVVPAEGDLANAPWGLGYLLEGGYLGDARAFFCPTAAESMLPVGWGADPGDTGRTYWYWAATTWTMSQLKRIGGFDRKALQFGDWSWAEVLSPGSGNKDHARAVLSNYNYRNVPVCIGTGAFTPKNQVVMTDVKPAQTVDAGGPVFKTQKQLGGRSLVSDSFSSGITLWYDDDEPVPGVGRYAHREGYNVLYGDWSAKWYGDPEQNIMWFPDSNRYISTDSEVGSREQVFMQWLHLSTVTEAMSVNGDALHGGYGPATQRVWHYFDVFNGIDK